MKVIVKIFQKSCRPPDFEEQHHLLEVKSLFSVPRKLVLDDDLNVTIEEINIRELVNQRNPPTFAPRLR